MMPVREVISSLFVTLLLLVTLALFIPLKLLSFPLSSIRRSHA
jgi:hypothetical protein